MLFGVTFSFNRPVITGSFEKQAPEVFNISLHILFRASFITLQEDHEPLTIPCGVLPL